MGYGLYKLMYKRLNIQFDEQRSQMSVFRYENVSPFMHYGLPVKRKSDRSTT